MWVEEKGYQRSVKGNGKRRRRGMAITKGTSESVRSRYQDFTLPETKTTPPLPQHTHKLDKMSKYILYTVIP